MNYASPNGFRPLGSDRTSGLENNMTDVEQIELLEATLVGYVEASRLIENARGYFIRQTILYGRLS